MATNLPYISHHLSKLVTANEQEMKDLIDIVALEKAQCQMTYLIIVLNLSKQLT